MKTAIKQAITLAIAQTIPDAATVAGWQALLDHAAPKKAQKAQKSMDGWHPQLMKGSKLIALNHAIVKDGMVHSTNCDQHLVTKTTLPDGIYRAQGTKLLPVLDNPQVWDTHRDVVAGLPVDWQTVATLPAADLASILAATLPAISEDETRLILQHILLEIDPAGIHAVATDGRRLHDMLATAETTGKADIIMPELPAAILSKLTTGQATIRTAKTQAGVFCRVESDGFSLTTKLYSGIFPNYRQVIPANLSARAIVLREAMIDAIGQLMPLARANTKAGSNYPRATLHCEGGALTLHCDGTPAKMPNQQSTIPCEESHPLSAAFNLQFLLDAFTAAQGEAVSLQFHEKEGGRHPIIILSGRFQAVIMPLRKS